MKIFTRILIDIESDRVIEADSYEYDGKVAECKGGSGGGTSTTTTQLPAWLQPYASQFIEAYEGQVFDESGNVIAQPANLNQDVASFNPTQETAMSNILGLTDQQQGLANLGMGQAGATLGGAYLHPESNPYLDATFQKASRAVTDAYSTSTAPSIMAAAQRSGNFGGSAMDEAMALSRYGLGENLGNLATSIYGGNYQQERANQLNTLQGLPNTLNAGYLPQQTALGIGAGQQQQQQTEMDTDYMNAVNAANYPFELLSGFGGALGQAGSGAGTSTTKAGQSSGMFGK